MFEKKNELLVKVAMAAACAPMLVGCLEAPEEELQLDDVEQHTICGPTNDAQHVNQYNGAFPGFPAAFVSARKNPVGAMESAPISGATFKYCSGTLIAADLFLTAGHCVDASTVGEFVSFRYELGPLPVPLPMPEYHVFISAVLEDELGGVDYAIVRLGGFPGSVFGITPVAPADPVPGVPIAMIGHPASAPKQVEAGTIASFAGDYMHYGNLDTLGGSSGSGILDAVGRIIGVHTNGGCTASGGTNSGVRIQRIRQVSAIL